MQLVEIGGKLHGAQLAPTLVEQHGVIVGLDGFEQEFGLALLLLVGGKRLGVFKLGNDLDVEGQIVPDAPHVFIGQGSHARVGGLAHDEESDFHLEAILVDE